MVYSMTAGIGWVCASKPLLKMPSNGNEYWVIYDSSLNDSLGEALLPGVIGINRQTHQRSQAIQSQRIF